MYAAFFGLTQPPFSIAPDPRYLYLSERHREALAHLLYGMESGGGFVLLTGEIGAGKTTVCRAVLEQLPAQARVAYIFNPKLTVNDLLQTICHEFGVAVQDPGSGSTTTIKDYLDPLNAHLLASHAAGEQNVLIIDEAQSLSPDVLEQLRLLTNLETNERKLLQIILIGQPELRQMLARPELEQLSQRVVARFHLGALNENETAQYVAHRLKVAGWKGGALLAPDALRRLFKLSGGVPRRINLLCDRAMLGAYASQQTKVTPAMVQQAASEVFGEPAHTSLPGASRLVWGGLGLGALIGAAATVALLWWWPAPEATIPATATAASPPPSTALAPVAPGVGRSLPSESQTEPATLPAEVPAPDLAGLPPGPPPQGALITSEDEAFRALGLHWGTPLGSEEPCLEAREHQLQCYRIQSMTVNGLRQFDRPAALKLQLPGQDSGYVLATAIDETAVELSSGSKRWRMPLTALPSIWSGYYVTLWRTPPGQQGRLNNGFVGPAAEWMEERLNALQAAEQLPSSAKTLKDKVLAFQAANGLETTGRASPTTLIMINRASGVEEPRLARARP